jgi:hypothetical protein
MIPRRPPSFGSAHRGTPPQHRGFRSEHLVPRDPRPVPGAGCCMAKVDSGGVGQPHPDRARARDWVESARAQPRNAPGFWPFRGLDIAPLSADGSRPLPLYKTGIQISRHSRCGIRLEAFTGPRCSYTGHPILTHGRAALCRREFLRLTGQGQWGGQKRRGCNHRACHCTRQGRAAPTAGNSESLKAPQAAQLLRERSGLRSRGYPSAQYCLDDAVALFSACPARSQRFRAASEFAEW